MLEAAQAGCALVLSDIPTHREIWDGAAIFVPGRDDAAFAAAISRPARRPASEREQLGRLARARAQHYTPERMARGMAEIYARVAASAAAPAADGGRGMRIVYFTHSLRSCWNHGNAHFLRGVLSELIARGHDVRVLEPEGAWSLANLLKDHGEEGLARISRAPIRSSSSRTYSRPEEGAAHAWGADLVIVHEWNDPELVAAVGRLRARGGRFTLLFHDTHHRAVSAPHEMRAYDLNAYDGVLAFGATLARRL